MLLKLAVSPSSLNTLLENAPVLSKAHLNKLVDCGVFMAHPWEVRRTTGVSLEQGLGLGDISRGRPGRRPGGECSSLPDY